MELHKLGNTNILVTLIGFGVLTIGETQLDMPVDEGAAVLSYALEKGINFIDTAQYYKTYPYIRKSLKDTGIRPVISSKSLDVTYNGMKDAVNEALTEMDIDYIDIFLLHEIRQGDDWESRSGAWEYLKEARSKGIVKAIGISTHHVDAARKMLEEPDADVVFPLINYASMGIRNGDGPGSCEDMAEVIKKLSKSGKGVFAMKVFGGGNLLTDYIKAMDYVFSLTGIDSAMIGFGKTEEVDRAIEYAEGRIDRDYAPSLKNKRIHIDQGDCEGCGTCVDRCTSRAIYMGENGLAQVDYEKCITCGYCAPVCPVRAIIMIDKKR